jgi:acetyl-CoA C-acetyltransferase
MFEAATKAYADAGINPREDVDGFVSAAEDLNTGTSIFDEYTPDQLGAVLKPLLTVGGDGIHALATAYMQIQTGALDVVVVEAHSKASEILDPVKLMNFASDPMLNRLPNVHPYHIAGLEMNRFLHETGLTEGECAQVVVKNRRNALANPNAAFGAQLTAKDVSNSQPLFSPLKSLDCSNTCDGAVVLVIATKEKARKMDPEPIWLDGIAWYNETPSLETRDWGRAVYVELAAKRAFKMARVKSPRKDIDLFEVDDTFSYKELQHLLALGVDEARGLKKSQRAGDFDVDGELPVNSSGGSLGVGNSLECTGLEHIYEAVQQLRGQAGKLQAKGVESAVVQSWRGLPTTSGAVAVLRAE